MEEGFSEEMMSNPSCLRVSRNEPHKKGLSHGQRDKMCKASEGGSDGAFDKLKEAPCSCSFIRIHLYFLFLFTKSEMVR